MTEDDARGWCAAHASTTGMQLLDRFAALVVDENQRQNLISPATCDLIWSRHIADSAQLLNHMPAAARSWLDIGSGPGFPGIVIAILRDLPVTLVEPRTRRVQFMVDAAAQLGLRNVAVQRAKAEGIAGTFDVISARAVASLPSLLAMTGHLRDAKTRLILPRGRNGAREVAELPAMQRRMFHVEQSVTDPDSVIVIADGVRA